MEMSILFEACASNKSPDNKRATYSCLFVWLLVIKWPDHLLMLDLLHPQALKNKAPYLAYVTIARMINQCMLILLYSLWNFEHSAI